MGSPSLLWRRAARLALGAGLVLALSPAGAGTQSAVDGRPWSRRVAELEARLLSAEPADDAVDEALFLLAELELALDAPSPPRDQAEALWRVATLLAELSGDERPAEPGALQMLALASRAAERLGPDEHAWAEWARAARLVEGGELGVARAALDEVLGKPLSPHVRPWLQTALAQIEAELGAFSEALRLLDATEAGLGALDPSWEAFEELRSMTLGVRGEVLLDLGLTDLAAEVIARERASAAASGQAERIESGWLHEADLFLATRRFEALERSAAEQLESESSTVSEPARLRMRLRRGIARAARGGLVPAQDEAAESDLRAVLARGALSAGEGVRLLGTLAQVLMRRGERGEAGELLLRARVLQGEPGRAGEDFEAAAMLAVLESKVARSATPDGAQLAELRAELEAEYARFLTAWEAAPLREGGLGFLHFGMRRALLGELIDLHLLEHEGEAGVEAALLEVQRAQALGSYARRSGYRLASSNALRQTLASPRHGILVYLPVAERSHLLAFDARRLVHCSLPSSGTISDAREELVALLFDADAGRVDAAPASAARLAAMLLPEALQDLLADWSSVTIVGLDLLGYAPFELLPLRDGRALGVALALDYLPSLPVGMLLAERPVPRCAHELTLLAAPAVAPEITARFPGVEAFAMDRARLARFTDAFGPERVRVATGAEASLDWLRAEGLDGRILMLLAHGVEHVGHELGAALALAPCPSAEDGLLTAARLRALCLPPVVVLAACGAGRARPRRGDDLVLGLGTVALEASASVVLVSPQDLELAPVEHLLGVFCARLRAGDAPAEALRRARVELEDTQPGLMRRALVHALGLGARPVFPR